MQVGVRVVVQPADRVAHGEGGPHRALRVVLVRGRRAEDGHHRVADELLDDAAELLDLCTDGREIRRKQVAHVFGVEPLGAAGRADEIGEEDGDDLALLARRLRLHRDRCAAGGAESRPDGNVRAAFHAGKEEGRPARHAEACTVRVLPATGRTHDHVPKVRLLDLISIKRT